MPALLQARAHVQRAADSRGVNIRLEISFGGRLIEFWRADYARRRWWAGALTAPRWFFFLIRGSLLSFED